LLAGTSCHPYSSCNCRSLPPAMGLLACRARHSRRAVPARPNQACTCLTMIKPSGLSPALQRAKNARASSADDNPGGGGGVKAGDA